MAAQKNVLIGRRTLITLYALVVILAISTVSIYLTYHNYISTQTNNNSEYDTLNNYLNNYILTHTNNNSEYDKLNDIVNLGKTEIVVNNLTINEPAEGYNIQTFPVQYAGYILVNLESSTPDQNFIEVVYTSNIMYYENKIIIVGYRGIAMFPVLPSDNIQVRIGTTNSYANVTQTFTITYYY